jgi:GH18 family chitinase
MLSIAVSAEKNTILKGYDIENIVEHLDFVSIMSYDYHGSWDKKVGHNSPLRSRKEESDEDKKLSSDYSVRLLATLGVPLEKLILGIPFYGRTFTLKNESYTYFDAEAVDNGVAGEFTREAGFLSLFEICKYLKVSNWTREWSVESEVPYAYNGNQWIGYDDEDSITLKVNKTL